MLDFAVRDQRDRIRLRWQQLSRLFDGDDPLFRRHVRKDLPRGDRLARGRAPGNDHVELVIHAEAQAGGNIAACHNGAQLACSLLPDLFEAAFLAVQELQLDLVERNVREEPQRDRRTAADHRRDHNLRADRAIPIFDAHRNDWLRLAHRRLRGRCHLVRQVFRLRLRQRRFKGL